MTQGMLMIPRSLKWWADNNLDAEHQDLLWRMLWHQEQMQWAEHVARLFPLVGGTISFTIIYFLPYGVIYALTAITVFVVLTKIRRYRDTHQDARRLIWRTAPDRWPGILERVSVLLDEPQEISQMIEIPITTPE